MQIYEYVNFIKKLSSDVRDWQNDIFKDLLLSRSKLLYYDFLILSCIMVSYLFEYSKATANVYIIP